MLQNKTIGKRQMHSADLRNRTWRKSCHWAHAGWTDSQWRAR